MFFFEIITTITILIVSFNLLKGQTQSSNFININNKWFSYLKRNTYKNNIFTIIILLVVHLLICLLYNKLIYNK